MPTKTVRAGKVPGGLTTVIIGDNDSGTVYDVLVAAAKQIGVSRNLGRPAFSVEREEYGTRSKRMIDVPRVNGVPLATKDGNRWKDVRWDTVVNDNDKVLLVPEIQGNVSTYFIGRPSGVLEEVSVFDSGEPGADEDSAGTFAAILSAFGIESMSHSDNLLAVFKDGEAYFVDEEEGIAEDLSIVLIVTDDEVSGVSDADDYYKSIQGGLRFPNGPNATPTNSLDPAELNEQASRLNLEASQLDEQAGEQRNTARATDQRAAELRQKAAELASKAAGISAARQSVESGLSQLVGYGILPASRSTTIRELLAIPAVISTQTENKQEEAPPPPPPSRPASSNRRHSRGCGSY